MLDSLGTKSTVPSCWMPIWRTFATLSCAQELNGRSDVLVLLLRLLTNTRHSTKEAYTRISKTLNTKERYKLSEFMS